MFSNSFSPDIPPTSQGELVMFTRKRLSFLFLCTALLLSVPCLADEKTDKEIKDEFANEQLKVLAGMYSKVGFVSASYQPYVKGYWWNTSQSFSVKIEGIKQLPEHELTVTFSVTVHGYFLL
ncbi:MAG: hypothetical protein LBN39_10750, partial [Planctomycetaceae bacterium]|nr:hypothetical protein [Planctomycetaceae bacterium]